MNILNRAAVTVTPKQPCIEWACGLFDDDPPADVQIGEWEPTTYLIRDVESETEVRRALKKHYAAIFENELACWAIDKRAWPKKRDYATFQAWFEVQVASIVLDLEASAVIVEPHSIQPLLP